MCKTSFLIKFILKVLLLILCNQHLIAQTPTLEEVTNSGSSTTQTLQLNRISPFPVPGNSNMIFGLNNTEFTGMTDVYVIGKGNIFYTNVDRSLISGFENKLFSSSGYMFGKSNTVNGNHSTAVGYFNKIEAALASSFGGNNTVQGNYGNALGKNNKVLNREGSAIGFGNTVDGDKGSAFGYGNISSGEASFASGYKSKAQGKSAVALGKESIASGEMSTSLGYKTQATAYNAIAIGKESKASGINAIAFGKGSVATNSESVAIGVGASSTGIKTIAIGRISNQVDSSLKIGINTNSYIFMNHQGNVAIGTTDPKGYKLAVAGNVIAESVTVKLQGYWPDYVFEDNYILPDLHETESFIKANRHLPGIPSAREVEENGISLGEMNAKLLKKIEELTLYLIEKNKDIEELKKQVEYLKN